jgi:iron complex transport system substrate-binding protein
LPSATEILFAIGAGDDLVAVTHECDYPRGALRLPKITSSTAPQIDDPGAIDRHVRAAIHGGSSLYALDAAALERLDPDLIVTQELCAVCAVSYGIVAHAAKRLRSDPRIVSLEPCSFEDVLATIGFLGELSGHLDEAARLVASLQERMRALSHFVLRQAQDDSAQCDNARLRTLVLEWTDPPMSAGHWIPDLVEIAGGEPILSHRGENSQRLEWETIRASQPDAVVVAPCGFTLEKTQCAVEALVAVEAWTSLQAVRKGRILAMDGNAYLSRPGPRLVDATEMIAKWYTDIAEYAG